MPDKQNENKFMAMLERRGIVKKAGSEDSDNAKGSEEKASRPDVDLRAVLGSPTDDSPMITPAARQPVPGLLNPKFPEEQPQPVKLDRVDPRPILQDIPKPQPEEYTPSESVTQNVPELVSEPQEEYKGRVSSILNEILIPDEDAALRPVIHKITEPQEPSEPLPVIHDISEPQKLSEPLHMIDDIPEPQGPSEPLHMIDNIPEPQEPSEPVPIIYDIPKPEEPIEPAPVVYNIPVPEPIEPHIAAYTETEPVIFDFDSMKRDTGFEPPAVPFEPQQYEQPGFAPIIYEEKKPESYTDRYLDIDELYDVLAMKVEKTSSIYLVEEYFNTLPDTIPTESRREIVGKIIAASGFDYDRLTQDGVLRVRMLKEYAEKFTKYTSDYVSDCEAELDALEQKMMRVRRLIDERRDLHKKQFFTIEAEAQRLKSIITLLSG